MEHGMRRWLAPGLATLWAVAAAAGAAAEGDNGFPSAATFVPAVVVGEANGAPVYRTEILSPVYTVDQIYKSMRGPMTSQYFTIDYALGKPAPDPELVYVTGYRAVMMKPDGVTDSSQEFMCHSNLDLDLTSWRSHFPTQLTFRDGRMFTLAQGQLSLDLPAGFGIPVMSQMPIGLDTQVLNHNIVGPPFGVRHRVQLEFQRASELPKPLTPLVQRSVFGMALVDGPDGHYGVRPVEVDESVHGAGCLPAADAGGPLHHATDDEGRTFTSFWVVPPGRQVNPTLVTDLLNLPYDTRVHYIAVHLHPFAESLTLTDLTTGETVYEARSKQVGQGVGLAAVEHFSSVEGLPLYKDHEYQLTSVYNNTSGVDQDSMAVMYLYMRAPDLEAALQRPPGRDAP